MAERKTGKKSDFNIFAWTAGDLEVFIMVFLGFLFLLVFSYVPMFGIVLAFKDGDMEANLLKVIFAGDWVGLKHFYEFITNIDFLNVLGNTILLNLLLLLFNFPAPILFAVMLNEMKNLRFKRSVQTVATFPHFLSWVVFGGIILALTNVNSGITTPIFTFLGIASPDNPINLGQPQYFYAVLIISSLLKNVGWGSIIYLAAIAGIDAALYEAAEIDGVNRFQRARYITLPSIVGTITIYFILNLSNLLSNSFEQFYVFQNSVNLSRSEVLSTYIYKVGIGSQQRRFSYAAMIGLFESLIGVLLLVVGNTLSMRLTGRGLFGAKEEF